jgi:hypothetical protein
MDSTRKPFDSNKGSIVDAPPNGSVETEKSGNADSGISSEITIDIRPLLEDVSQLMTKHISKMLEGVVGDYTLYKQTHDVIMNLPIIKTLQNKVYSLESQLKSHENDGGEGGCVRDVPTQPPHQGTPPNNTSNDYDEVIQLKKLIDNLTKHITHLESQMSTRQTQREDASARDDQHHHDHNHDNCENGVRLEIHENENELQSESDESDDESNSKLNHQNKIVHTTNVMTDHQAEISDHDDDSQVDGEEENEEAASEDDKEAAEEVDSEEDAVDEEEGVAEDAGEEEEEAAEEAVEEEEEVAAADEDEIEVSEIKIKGKVYFTTNSQNGIIYACVNDDVGDEVGVFKNGIALFNAKK